MKGFVVDVFVVFICYVCVHLFRKIFSRPGVILHVETHPLSSVIRKQTMLNEPIKIQNEVTWQSLSLKTKTQVILSKKQIMRKFCV